VTDRRIDRQHCRSMYRICNLALPDKHGPICIWDNMQSDVGIKCRRSSTLDEKTRRENPFHRARTRAIGPAEFLRCKWLPLAVGQSVDGQISREQQTWQPRNALLSKHAVAVTLMTSLTLPFYYCLTPASTTTPSALVRQPFRRGYVRHRHLGRSRKHFRPVRPDEYLPLAFYHRSVPAQNCASFRRFAAAFAKDLILC